MDKKRYILYNQDRIGIKLMPNTRPLELIDQKGKLLASEVYKYVQTNNIISKRIATVEKIQK